MNFQIVPDLRVLGKVAVTGQTAFRETTLVALSRLGLDAMIS
jgi:hypothetical protein